MRLFLDRAKAVAPGLRTDERAMMAVARLCRRLDGVPLAIELAASHMRGLSATQLADQLDDRFKLLADGEGLLIRHHTLRTAAGWSHELCTPPNACSGPACRSSRALSTSSRPAASARTSACPTYPPCSPRSRRSPSSRGWAITTACSTRSGITGATG
ncbi:hypothetical protein ACFQX6_35440 [Streptosporangium lutulentum]